MLPRKLLLSRLTVRYCTKKGRAPAILDVMLPATARDSKARVVRIFPAGGTNVLRATAKQRETWTRNTVRPAFRILWSRSVMTNKSLQRNINIYKKRESPSKNDLPSRTQRHGVSWLRSTRYTRLQNCQKHATHTKTRTAAAGDGASVPLHQNFKKVRRKYSLITGLFGGI